MASLGNTGNFGRQRFSLHGVDLTKFDGGGARDVEDHPSAPQASSRVLLYTRENSDGKVTRSEIDDFGEGKLRPRDRSNSQIGRAPEQAAIVPVVILLQYDRSTESCVLQ